MATYYSPKITTDGLILCLDAGNVKSYISGSSTWNDMTISGINGTLTNGPTFSSTNGGSIAFDGVDDKVTFPNTTISTTNGITVDLWFKTSSGTKYQDIFDMADAYGVWIVTNYSGAGTGKIVASFNTITGYMSANYVVDTWYAVTLAGTGSTNFLYINGSLITTGVQTVASSVNFNTARIGNVDGDRAAEYLVGNVSSLKFYNRCLSASEVLQNYNAAKTRYGL